MVKEYQVTLLCKSGKYRPVSCIIKHEELDLSIVENKKILVKKGTEKICIKRYWTNRDLKKYEYLTAKVREYDKVKIAAANEERYNAIKEAKYKSGEWKKPTK